MFRGSMPFLTVTIFLIGAGVGLSWSRGLIPVTILPVNTGTLSPEFSHREKLPRPPEPSLTLTFRDDDDAQEATVADQKLVQDQSEPELEIDSQASTDHAGNNDAPSLPAAPSTGRADQRNLRESAPEDEARPVIRLGKRAQKTLPLGHRAEATDEPVAEKPQKVVTAAHQDDTDSASDGTEKSRSSQSKEEPSPKELLAMAEEKLANGDTLKAHRDLSTIYWNHKEFRQRIQDLIDSTAKAIFFQPKPHYLDPYVIQDSERLEAIAKRYHLSWEYLAKLNRTNPKRIQVGQKLKVIKGPFGAVVDLKDFVLTVHLQGYYVKRYDIGIGKENSSPIGEFPVLNKVENPEYTDSRTGKVIKGDDPTNPLGKRWIDLGDSYGIHGTIDPASIGRAESRGCIRMRDADIIEVYDFLVKGSKVVLQ